MKLSKQVLDGLDGPVVLRGKVLLSLLPLEPITDYKPSHAQ